MNIIRIKVFNHVDDKIGIKILNNGLISKSFGLNVDWDIYIGFCNQSNMAGHYFYWNPIEGITDNKLETYNFK